MRSDWSSVQQSVRKRFCAAVALLSILFGFLFVASCLCNKRSSMANDRWGYADWKISNGLAIRAALRPWTLRAGEGFAAKVKITNVADTPFVMPRRAAGHLFCFAAILDSTGCVKRVLRHFVSYGNPEPDDFMILRPGQSITDRTLFRVSKSCRQPRV